MIIPTSWGKWRTPTDFRFFPSMPASGLTTREMLASALAQAKVGQTVNVIAREEALDRLARRLTEVLDETASEHRSGWQRRGRRFEIGLGSVHLLTPEELAG